MAVWTLLLGGVLYGLLLAGAYSYQRNLIFPAPDIYLIPSVVGVPEMDEIKLETEVGELTAWWSPPRAECQASVMVMHGNGSAIFSNVDIYRDLIDAGYGVWGVAYPGYPGSTGAASEAAMVKAAAVQYDALRDRVGEAGRIHFYGTSIGSGVAAQLSAVRSPEMLFLDAPFYSVAELIKSNLWWMPVERLLTDPFRSNEALEGLSVPLFWTHGTNDTIVPLAHGQRLYDGYKGPKQSLIIEGGAHTNLWGLGGRAFVMAGLAGGGGGPNSLPSCRDAD